MAIGHKDTKYIDNYRRNKTKTTQQDETTDKCPFQNCVNKTQKNLQNISVLGKDHTTKQYGKKFCTHYESL
jgi:hypothetical protein